MKYCVHFLTIAYAATFGVLAAPVDLTPPRNVLGYADEMGHFRMVQRFGEIKFSDGFELPLRFEFWTGRSESETKSAFGWDSWHCGPLESTAGLYGGGDRYLKATLLCAKTLYLEKSDKEKNTYYTLNGAWKGVIDGDLISISREDGWDLRFTGGKVSSLQTDSGLLITWHWGKDGKLDSISESKSKDTQPLQVLWNEDRSAVKKLVLPTQSVEFSHDKTKPPASRLNVSHITKRETRSMTFDLFADALEITEFNGVIRRFNWTLPDRHLISDGLNKYQVSKAEGQATLVEMETASGKSLSRQADVGKGVAIATDASGITHRIHRITEHSAAHRSISHIERLVGEEFVLVMQNSFDDAGRLLERKWLGSPFLHNSYSNGKVEECLTPQSEVSFHSEPVPNLDTYSIIKYSFDQQGNHTETTVDGKLALQVKYDNQSRPLLYQVGSRFERNYVYQEDGTKIEKLVIPRVTDRKFGFLNSTDPSITGELIIEKVLDNRDRLVKKQMLDQTFQTFSYDEEGRLRSFVITAADGSTLVLESTFVYQPHNPTALLIEKDHMNGETRYHEITFEPNGKFKKGKPITSFAAKNQLKTTP